MLSIILAIENEQDRKMVEDLYLTYEKKLYQTAMDILHNHQDAEDCVNDTILNVIEYLPKYREISATHRTNLLFITCRNISINLYNKNKKDRKHTVSITNHFENTDIPEYDIVDYEADVSKIVINQQNAETVGKLLRDLPTVDRDIMILKYYYQMKTQEIAKSMQLTEDAVYARIKRSKKQMLEKGELTLNDLRAK